MVSGDRAITSTRTRRIALIIQYDGTSFNGWQYQPKGRFIQNELERACTVLCGHRVKTIAAGRTDAGVHATGQVVHFDTSSNVVLSRICYGLNGILPIDIAIKNAFEVPGSFNARFDAVEREYIYIINNDPLRSPFSRFRAMSLHHKFDIEYAKRASSFLLGEHDFSSFCKSVSARGKNTVRTINEITWEKRGTTVFFVIKGNGFLHNMVRTIVGTVVEMHKRGMEPEMMKTILEMGDRSASGDTAPPYGLYLTRVWYSPDLQDYPSAFEYGYHAPGYFI
jgi:tRNA pseudouridine38-40 synthase